MYSCIPFPLLALLCGLAPGTVSPPVLHKPCRDRSLSPAPGEGLFPFSTTQPIGGFQPPCPSQGRQQIGRPYAPIELLLPSHVSRDALSWRRRVTAAPTSASRFTLCREKSSAITSSESAWYLLSPLKFRMNRSRRPVAEIGGWTRAPCPTNTPRKKDPVSCDNRGDKSIEPPAPIAHLAIAGLAAKMGVRVIFAHHLFAGSGRYRPVPVDHQPRVLPAATAQRHYRPRHRS